jgi:hypothetical protein
MFGTFFLVDRIQLPKFDVQLKWNQQDTSHMPAGCMDRGLCLPGRENFFNP